MSVRGSQPIARSITAFLPVLDRLNPPIVVRRIQQALEKATKAKKPVATMNRSIAQVRRHASDDDWKEAVYWLYNQHSQEMASSQGASWSLDVWQAALIHLDDGKRANVAFGMGTPGNPRSMRFTAYMDAAVYWQILTLEGMRSEEALSKALEIGWTLAKPGDVRDVLSVSDVRKVGKALPKLDGSDAALLRHFKEAIEQKYSLTPKTGD